MWIRAFLSLSVVTLILMVINLGLIGAVLAGVAGALTASLALSVVILGLVAVPPVARAIALRYANPRRPDGPEVDYHDPPA
jgi:hypothetical protein